MEIKYVSVCDIGKCRSENQDSIYIETGDGWGFFVVADGMGGHSDGARASREITAAYEAWMQEKKGDITEYALPDLFSELREVLSKANDKIIRDTAEGKICGSTAVVLLIIRDTYVLLSVGDSRCYDIKRCLFRDSLRQLSSDEICEIPGRDFGKLTNAVGVKKPLKCRLISGMVNKRHTFFICTDGVYKFCTTEELLALIKRKKGRLLETAGEEIKELIYGKGAKDNLSAVLITVSF